MICSCWQQFEGGDGGGEEINSNKNKKKKYENMDNRYVTCIDYDNDFARHGQCFTGHQCLHLNPSESTTLAIKLKTFIMAIKS